MSCPDYRSQGRLLGRGKAIIKYDRGSVKYFQTLPLEDPYAHERVHPRTQPIINDRDRKNLLIPITRYYFDRLWALDTILTVLLVSFSTAGVHAVADGISRRILSFDINVYLLSVTIVSNLLTHHGSLYSGPFLLQVLFTGSCIAFAVAIACERATSNGSPIYLMAIDAFFMLLILPLMGFRLTVSAGVVNVLGINLAASASGRFRDQFAGERLTSLAIAFSYYIALSLVLFPWWHIILLTLRVKRWSRHVLQTAADIILHPHKKLNIYTYQLNEGDEIIGYLTELRKITRHTKRIRYHLSKLARGVTNGQALLMAAHDVGTQSVSTRDPHCIPLRTVARDIRRNCVPSLLLPTVDHERLIFHRDYCNYEMLSVRVTRLIDVMMRIQRQGFYGSYEEDFTTDMHTLHNSQHNTDRRPMPLDVFQESQLRHYTTRSHETRDILTSGTQFWVSHHFGASAKGVELVDALGGLAVNDAEFEEEVESL